MKLGDLIKAIFSDFLDHLTEKLPIIRRASDPNYSTGDELENIRAVERAARGTNEAEQRQLIFAKIAENNSNGKFADLVNIVEIMGGGEVQEFEGRFDAILDLSVNYPVIVANSLRKAKTFGVKENVYVNNNIFRFDRKNLDISQLGEKL